MTLLKKVMLILCFLLMLYMAQSSQDGWQKLWDGPVGKVVCSSDLGLFATRQDTGDIYQYRGPNDWIKIGGPAKKFIATTDGLYGLSPDGQGIWKYTGNPEEWIQVGGPASAVYGGGHVLLATNPNTGDLYLYINPMEWFKIGGPGKTFVVTDSQSRSHFKLVGLSPDSNSIWNYTGDIYTAPWKQIGGPAKEIYSSLTSPGLYATNPETGDIYSYEFPKNKWTRIGGLGKMFVADDSGRLYGLSNDGNKVWKYMGVPDDWVQIGGPAKEIYAGCSDLYLVSRGQRNLFHWTVTEVNISSIQYPTAPETVTVGEFIPIVVTIAYDNLVESDLSMQISCVDPPRTTSEYANVTLSGSGTYQFPPLVYGADLLYHHEWPQHINEWHLTAELRKGDELLTSKDFTLLVEDPEYKPDVWIENIEFISPPESLAVGEESPVKIHTNYSNLAAGTKIEAALRDQSGLLASRLSRSLSGSGQLTFGMNIKPKVQGTWVVEADVNTVPGSLLAEDKKYFQISVVSG